MNMRQTEINKNKSKIVFFFSVGENVKCLIYHLHSGYGGKKKKPFQVI